MYGCLCVESDRKKERESERCVGLSKKGGHSFIILEQILIFHFFPMQSVFNYNGSIIVFAVFCVSRAFSQRIFRFITMTGVNMQCGTSDLVFLCVECFFLCICFNTVDDVLKCCDGRKKKVGF